LESADRGKHGLTQSMTEERPRLFSSGSMQQQQQQQQQSSMRRAATGPQLFDRSVAARDVSDAWRIAMASNKLPAPPVYTLEFSELTVCNSKDHVPRDPACVPGGWTRALADRIFCMAAPVPVSIHTMLYLRGRCGEAWFSSMCSKLADIDPKAAGLSASLAEGFERWFSHSIMKQERRVLCAVEPYQAKNWRHSRCFWPQKYYHSGWLVDVPGFDQAAGEAEAIRVACAALGDQASTLYGLVLRVRDASRAAAYAALFRALGGGSCGGEEEEGGEVSDLAAARIDRCPSDSLPSPRGVSLSRSPGSSSSSLACSLPSPRSPTKSPRDAVDDASSSQRLASVGCGRFSACKTPANPCQRCASAAAGALGIVEFCFKVAIDTSNKLI
jgi:hypothetical protein